MEQFIKHLLDKNQISTSKRIDKVISRLIQSAKVEEIYKNIISLNQEIMNIFNRYNESEEFKEFPLAIPNANAKTDYSFQFDISKFPNIKISKYQNKRY